MVSPSDISPGAKLAIGLGSGVLMWTFLALAGRRESHLPDDDQEQADERIACVGN